MPIDLAIHVKHELAKGLIQAILKQAGYRIVPTGMENLLREIAPLSKQAYDALALPHAIRTLPDFIVMDEKVTTRQLVEVKYRSKLEPELLERLKFQTNAIGEMTLVLIHGRSTGAGTAKDLGEIVRCCRLERTDKGVTFHATANGVTTPKLLKSVTSATLWTRMSPMRSLFGAIGPTSARLEGMVETAARALAA